MERTPAEPEQSLTCVAGAATPARGTAAQEGVSVVEAGPSITAGGGVALALTWIPKKDQAKDDIREETCLRSGRAVPQREAIKKLQ